jgi:RNA polymerase sigma factor (sigma-70 family)
VTAELDVSSGSRMADTDSELIDRARREPEVFAAVYDRHAPAIHRYIARRLGPDLADDLMAETFLLAFRQRERYDLTRSDARPWLYGIATNLVRQHRRAEGRFWRALARSGVDPVVESPAERVSERVSAQGARRDIAAALVQLNQGQRDVLLLTAVGGLSPVEIGTALKVATGTVHSRLNRARRKMREVLGGIDPFNAREEVIS